jgi:hypothetical protein
LGNVGGFFKMLDGDEDFTMPGLMGFSASQVIPLEGFIRNVNQILDPVYRKASGFKETVMKDLPFFSQQLPAYKTPDGEDSKRLPINTILPYDVGQVNPEYQTMYGILQKRNQETAFENAQMKQLEREMEKESLPDSVKYNSEGLSPEAKFYVMDKDLADYMKTKEPSNILDKGKWSSKRFDKAVDVYNSDLDEGSKKLLFDQMGVEAEDVKYYDTTTAPETARFQFITEELNNISSQPQRLEHLVQYRKKVSGKQVLTDGLVKDLFDLGFITSSEKKYLQNLEYDEVKGEFYMDRAYSGSGGGSKKLPTMVSLSDIRSASELKPITYKQTKTPIVKTIRDKYKLSVDTSEPKISVYQMRRKFRPRQKVFLGYS